MTHDRYERRHRRTTRNDACVEMMAGANFDAVPSLAEAMGLEEPSVTHTHVGCRSRVGHVHSGAKLWGHRVPKAGRRHALNGGPSVFTALCGERVAAEEYDDFGFRIEGGPNNVRPVGHPVALAVTCKRCLRRIKQA